jgi:membrane protease YdiL (CAAX protease family)
MSAMVKSLRGFPAVVLAGWVALSAAGVLYARYKGIPNQAALPVVAAFLVAFPFYLVPVFPRLRERIGGPRLPAYVLAAALAPYLTGWLGGGIQFHWGGLARLAAMALVFGLWYLPSRAHSPIADLAFLALIPLVLLSGYLEAIYIAVHPALQKDLIELGHLALIEIAVPVLMVARGVRTGYGFFPTRAEWTIGLRHYLYFAAAGLPLGLALRAVHFTTPAPLWKIAATFLGFFWVIALSEEFFVRGVLQGWLEQWTKRASLALLVTSALFGAAHLFFRIFPNWRWALLAAILGWCCGHARNQAGGIRAGVVTHALVVTTWRAFLA